MNDLHENQAARRTARASTTDARAVRTRERLLEALSDILAEGGDADLSAAHVSARAGISKATFYTHFRAVEQLAEYGLADLFEAISGDDALHRSERAVPRREIASVAIRRLVDRLVEDPRMLVLALTVQEHSALRAMFFDRIEASILTAIRIEGVGGDPVRDRRITRMLGVGVGTVLIDWLREGRPEPPDVLVGTILDLLPPWVAGEESPNEDRSGG
jgi:AcrR family transcriptional regulator